MVYSTGYYCAEARGVPVEAEEEDSGAQAMQSIVTITTDFGTRDGFVAQMKGVILSTNPDALILDISHEIEPFSILEGALVLKGAYKFFPCTAVHLAVVDPGVGSSRRSIAIQTHDGVFVGPDNGIFSLVLSEAGDVETREITNPEFMLVDPHPTFHGRDIFARTAGLLSAGRSVEDVGPIVDRPVRLGIPSVSATDKGLTGEVIYTDRFGNLTTSIEADMLLNSVGSVEIRDAKIDGVGRFYAQVAEGEPMALVNSFGYLEIAINQGNAAEVLGVGISDRVRLFWA